MRISILFITLFSSLLTIAQSKSCDIDYTIKNDSTDFVKTNEYLFVEKSYPNSLESLYMSLIKSDEQTYVQLQYLQRDTQFISTSCVDTKSMITLQLLNGTIVNLKHANVDYCNSLTFDTEQNANIRILSTYFQIQKDDLKRLKESPVSVMRVRFSTNIITYEVVDKIESKAITKTFYPSKYFMENITCIE